jgi:hypothetical protein
MTILRLVLLLATVASPVFAAKGCGDAERKAVRNARFRVSWTPSLMESVMISAWGGGGGPRNRINDESTADGAFGGTGNPFSGRDFGGGERKNGMYGTRAYGSGYPYGGDGSSTSVAGRPFPFGVWPISWGPNYMGGGEYYGEDLDLLRPGGPVGVVRVGTKNKSRWPNVTDDEVYEMIGDKESLAFMTANLVDVCAITPQWPRKFDPTMLNSTKPENVIQYYRASSFALAFSNYNNTFALPSSNPTTTQRFDQSVPLPSLIVNSDFLHCINDTIKASLPIQDSYERPKNGLTGGEIAGIVIGSLIGGLGLCIILYSLCIKCCGSDDIQVAPVDMEKARQEEEEAAAAAKLSEENKEEEAKTDGATNGDVKKDSKDPKEQNVVYL